MYERAHEVHEPLPGQRSRMLSAASRPSVSTSPLPSHGTGGGQLTSRSDALPRYRHHRSRKWPPRERLSPVPRPLAIRERPYASHGDSQPSNAPEHSNSLTLGSKTLAFSRAERKSDARGRAKQVTTASAKSQHLDVVQKPGEAPVDIGLDFVQQRLVHL